MFTSRTRTFVLLSVASLAGLTTLSGQQVEERFRTTIQTEVELGYLLHLPPAEPGTEVRAKLPLILFLHGAGERGNDLQKVKTHGPPRLAERDPTFPFAVLSPQCPEGGWWEPKVLLALLEHVCTEQPIDRDRIYLTGLSMGGYGSWALAAAAPERFAAVAPICGGGKPETAEKLRELPFWVFHGARDPVVPIDRSREMVDALEKVGADVRFTVDPEAGHDSWTAAYDDPELYAWFLSHSRATAPAAGVGMLPRAAPEDVGMSSRGLQKVADAIDDLIDAQRVAGTVTIVARRGRIVLEHVAGHRDLESGTAMTADTLFRIYSMSKPVTSVAAMILVEEGELDLDGPVANYLPEFEDLQRYVSGGPEDMHTAPLENEMTVRDLLRHTSGLTYGFFGNSAVDQSYRAAGIGGPEEDLATLVENLGHQPLLNEPGTRWVYSLSTDVLGRVVEVVSGQRFGEFLKERIFTPLEMVDTAFSVPVEKLARFATNYTPERGGGLRVADHPESSRFAKPAVNESGGGGLVSTAGDYLRFCQMLLNGGTLDGVRILEPETVAEMTRDQLPASLRSNRFGFGLGFSVSPTDSAGRSKGEYGWGGAASTHFWISPEDQLIVVALSQIMPQSNQLDDAIHALVHSAIEDRGERP